MDFIETDTTHLTQEQLLAFEKFTSGENLFITGPGGTGKSMFIKTIVEYCQKNNKIT